MADLGITAEPAQSARTPISAADLLIAIPTYNNAETIGSIVQAARAALLQFPQRKTMIAQVDGGSSDSTLQQAKAGVDDEESFAQLSYPLYPFHGLEIAYHPVPGRDSAYRTIFSLADQLGVTACCIVAGNSVVTPDWIASLMRPIADLEFDLATPLYERNKYSGPLVKGIVYPLVRSLFGKRVRQPIASDFGYSRALIRRMLATESWQAEAARRDIDLSISLLAMEADMKICQVRLGSRPRIAGGQDVTSILSGVGSALFFEMERTAELWQRIRGSNTVPVFGLRFDPEPAETVPNPAPMIGEFRLGCDNLQDIWALILSPATLLSLKRMGRQTEQDFRFDDELWARIIFDFAVAHRMRVIGRDHLFGALTPLYKGWLASFITSLRNSNAHQAENQVEKLGMAFESQKPYLISRWRWPDRFMP